MNFNPIKVTDLQAKHSTGESADNRIRKSWSIQMPDEVKAKFKHLPRDVKQQLYKAFDSEVNEIWTELLAKGNTDAAAAGAKEVRVSGYRRLEDSFARDPDEVLIEAAQTFIVRFAERPIK